MNKLIVVGLMVASSILACSKKPMTDTGLNIPLKSQIKYDNKTVSIFFDSVISDSRCPKDVNCVWAGTAVAQFRLVKNNVNYPFILTTNKSAKFAYNTDTTLAGYKITFVNMVPYPATSTQVTNEPITALVKVMKE